MCGHYAHSARWLDWRPSHDGGHGAHRDFLVRGVVHIRPWHATWWRLCFRHALYGRGRQYEDVDHACRFCDGCAYRYRSSSLVDIALEYRRGAAGRISGVVAGYNFAAMWLGPCLRAGLRLGKENAWRSA